MKPDSSRQMLLERTSGHSRFRMPKASHIPNPVTVSTYMPSEISWVFLERIIFQAWGAKLAVDRMAAM